MGPEIQIREMIAADLEPVTRLYAEVFDLTYISHSELAEGKVDPSGMPSAQAVEIFSRQLAQLLASAKAGLFVAVSPDHLVGFVVAKLCRTEAGHLECWLDDLAVSQPWRGRGIARALVARILDWGARAGAKYFLLEAGVRNEAAQRLYERLGFRPVSKVFYRTTASAPRGDR